MIPACERKQLISCYTREHQHSSILVEWKMLMQIDPRASKLLDNLHLCGYDYPGTVGFVFSTIMQRGPSHHYLAPNLHSTATNSH